MEQIITNAMITEYKEFLIDEEKGSVTIDKYIRDILAFKEWLSDRQLDKTAVLEYKQRLIDCYSPATVNSVLSSLNGFFMHNEWFGLRAKSLKIQRKIFCRPETELTKAEYENLLRAAKHKHNERLYLVMQTICSTGIRVSELNFITVEAVKEKIGQVKMKGKIRTVLLPKELCTLLMKYAKEQEIKSGCIFITKSGKPLDRSNIWADMKKLCELAGVAREKVFPHNLRHLFARTYYSIQKDIVRLADILGHSNVNTTRIYTIENGEIHRQQIQHLGLVCMRI